ncbi:Fumarate reductase flavoprotein subunit [Sinobacterium norvegicum]|uniref:Fumarate reductase flavoprotein subunit n=1 Tax=Sinobacterium norvegicum TaxID=1641715 RepID=A0ABM9AGC5_9GAMM|nr:FAD-binding protein [Sinobacterium norvegicum]CAH0992079.1 Fumarate reductase flavoprotein subunit [Sinobacterium norvegicum]
MDANNTAADFAVIDVTRVDHWHEEADVIVVGFGAAGSCAAIEAAEAGADVLVLERASGISGTTCAATGHFYLGGGTPPQRANGIDDSSEAMFDYLMANTPQPDEQKIRLYCEQSVEHFHWLTDQGVPFNNGFYRKKHFEQPTDECLIWSGNEKVWPISQQAKPAPRGHKVEKTGSEGGGLVMKHLTAKAQSSGVRFQHDAAVKNLLLDGDRVVGVSYSHFKEQRFVRAHKAVILAAGGFAMNQQMMDQYCPRLADPRVYKQGNPFDDGSGIELGMSVGGATEHMDGALITSPFYPPQELLFGIMVNNQGQRFINEDSYHARTAAACLAQPDDTVYLIADNDTFGRPELGMQELIDAWETVAEMEQDLQLPTGALQKTMADYNRAAENGSDPEQHKYKDWVKPLNNPPYAAIECSFGKSFYVGFTLGGLKVNVDGQVINQQQQVVDGLYAAGACASNIAQDGAGYSSGTCIGESTFFGRRAGRHAGQ